MVFLLMLPPTSFFQEEFHHELLRHAYATSASARAADSLVMIIAWLLISRNTKSPLSESRLLHRYRHLRCRQRDVP